MDASNKAPSSSTFVGLQHNADAGINPSKMTHHGAANPPSGELNSSRRSFFLPSCRCISKCPCVATLLTAFQKPKKANHPPRVNDIDMDRTRYNGDTTDSANDHHIL
mmetsp:Transcript_51693/g.75648  ORF Transcript_51693/g.75648 Transcript_51693/m.75648 type:complete len:107 (+) Transcript_51693:50-370(+)